jgi:sugar/nucleoside kinase (ribokinase family)
MDLDILTLGDLVADLLLTIPRLPLCPNEDQIARGLAAEPGGMGNYLILARRLGARVAPVGALGDDPYGTLILEGLAAEGVDTEAVERLPGCQSTQILVFVSDAGEHVFVGALGSARMGAATLRSVNERLPRARAFYTNGYAFLEADSPDLVVEALLAARRQSVQTVFDPGPQAANIDRGLMQRAVAASDVLFVTGEEAAALTGGCGPEEAAADLLERGPGLVVVKLGLEGCLVASAGERLALPGIPVAARDSAGAGDAFDAAFTLARLRGLPLDRAGKLANAAGAATAARIGAGRRLPDRSDVLDLLAGDPDVLAEVESI